MRLSAFFLLFAASFSLSANTLIFSAIPHPSAPEYKQLLTTTYQQLGYDIAFEDMPVERRLIELNSGKLDGDLAARGALQQAYTRLRQVLPAIAQGQILLVCQPDLPCNEQVLSNPTATVYLHRGTLNFLSSQQAAPASATLNVIDNPNNLLALFAKRRIQYFLLTSIDADCPAAISVPNATFLLGAVPIYHYLHERHEALIPEVSAELTRQLKHHKNR